MKKKNKKDDNGIIEKSSTGSDISERTADVLTSVPEGLWSQAAEEGLTPDMVRTAVKLDRAPDGTPADNYTFFDGRDIWFVYGITVLRKKKKKGVRRLPLASDFKCLGVVRTDISTWRDFAVERQISGCLITAKNDFGNVMLCRISAAAEEGAIEFCDDLGELLGYKDKNDRPKREKPDRCPKCGEPYPDQGRKVCPKCIDRAGVVKRLWLFMKKYRFSIFAIFGAMVLSSALTILAPYISSGFFYDSVLTEGGRFYGQVLLVVGILVATRILSLLVNMVNEIVTAIVVPKITYDLKKVIFTSIERLSIGFFTGRQTGSLMNQVNGDANTIYWFFVEGLPYIIISVVQTTVIAVVMFLIDWRLSLLAVMLTPVVVILTRLLFNHMNKLHAKRYSAQRSLSGMLTDVLDGVRVVKAFARENEEKSRFEVRSTNLAKHDQKVSLHSTVLFRMMTFFFTVSSAVILGVGGWSVIKGEMNYGMLITFTAYTSMLYSPLTSFVSMADWMSNAANAMYRLMEVMDAEPEVVEAESPVTLDRLKGDIKFKNVSFSYEKNRKIIDGISFEINAGESVGIVGHTGAGKSTVANLLIRLYDVKDGEITIDGYNVKELSFDTLRRNIAIVSQETYLFQGTIFENIAYARPDATYDQVVRASRIAGAHEFICKLQDGYSTKIGRGYMNLSGGERQRVSIARALLRDPSILILDEATSAMDTRTERSIQDALARLSSGRTTIMIAHRLSTLRNADKLLVLENGRIPEAGTHGELIRMKGIYYKLYTLQYEALKNAGIEES